LFKKQGNIFFLTTSLRKKLTELEYYNLFLSESKESPFLQKEKKGTWNF